MNRFGAEDHCRMEAIHADMHEIQIHLGAIFASIGQFHGRARDASGPQIFESNLIDQVALFE